MSLIIVVSTVALRVEVPAKGKRENATFPSGHDVNEESVGEGTANAVEDGDDAKTGDDGSMKFETINPDIPCIAFRLPIALSVEGDSGLCEKSLQRMEELSDSLWEKWQLVFFLKQAFLLCAAF